MAKSSPRKEQLYSYNGKQNTNNFENLQKQVPNKDTPFCHELPLVVDSL